MASSVVRGRECCSGSPGGDWERRPRTTELLTRLASGVGALETASPRYRPMVLLSLTNAQIAAGDPAAARATFDQAGAVQDTLLAPLYQRIQGNLLLAEGKQPIWCAKHWRRGMR